MNQAATEQLKQAPPISLAAEGLTNQISRLEEAAESLFHRIEPILRQEQPHFEIARPRGTPEPSPDLPVPTSRLTDQLEDLRRRVSEVCDQIEHTRSRCET